MRPLSDHDLTLTSQSMHLTVAAAARFMGISENATRHRRKRILDGPTEIEVWSDEELQILLDNTGKTSKQLAEVLPGRTPGAIGAKYSELRKRGLIGSRLAPGDVRDRLLLAKTCTKCGELRSACCYTKRISPNVRGGVRWNSACSTCLAEHTRERSKGKKQNKSRRLLQDISLEHATKTGDGWTEPEVKVLADSSKTAIQKALLLRRTYNAVQNAVRTFGLRSKCVGPDQGGDWIIKFSS